MRRTAAAQSVPKRRVGLFGGTFDPPHRAHLAFAHAALAALHLDEIRFVPAGQPWQKTGSGKRGAASHVPVPR